MYIEKRSNVNKRSDEIEAMIGDENDPKQRAFLIILNSINNTLVASAGLIKEVSTKLEGHLVKYDDRTTADDALLNKGKGVWIVAAWALGLLQVAAVAFFLQLKDDISTLHEFAAFNKNTNATQQAEIKVIADSLKAKP